jgi:hypothetical protein
MNPNSRGLVWLRREGDPDRALVHAFHTLKDGKPTTSLCHQHVNPEGWMVGSRRVGKACRECTSIERRIPKQIGLPCPNPQPNGTGSACRNCKFSIQPTYPGWVHVTRGGTR